MYSNQFKQEDVRKKSNKKISVIITAHNRKDYLERALNSVLNQSLERDLYEIIMVKNFEDSVINNLIQKYNLKSILVPENSMVGYDLALGIEKSNGEIISFLDDDDVFTENKLETICDIFNTESVSYVKNEIYFINDEDQILNRKNRLEIKSDLKLKNESLSRKIAYLNRVKAGFNLSSISIKRDIIGKEILEFIKKDLVHSTDTFFFCCSISSGKDIFLSSKRLTGYRMNESTSKQLGSDRDSLVKKITFWNDLLGVYRQFSDFFGGVSSSYLKNRICSQILAREIVKIEYEMPRSDDFSVFSCFFNAVRTHDPLIMYDILRYFKAKLNISRRSHKTPNNTY